MDKKHQIDAGNELESIIPIIYDIQNKLIVHATILGILTTKYLDENDLSLVRKILDETLETLVKSGDDIQIHKENHAYKINHLNIILNKFKKS
ncbi:hypothetical protein [Providencia alcalifaciens]|uniref:hypothetical protein n=1 Tax=Providencia alcalifaciens TaxID=126385 RepID=UPI001CC64539|nr:hypothetical protein [Providencia alcalifaciens]CAG9416510.1 hypothetical protein NVI2019_GHJFPKLH_01394 [Providencia alcalifaciens]